MPGSHRFLATSSIAVAALVTVLAADARAATLLALTGERTLTVIDTAGPNVTDRVNVTGPSGRLLGIDVRPSDGRLYGLLPGGRIVTINPGTGRATLRTTLASTLPPGDRASVDFNPVSGGLRLISTDGTNLRANVDDGSVVVDPDLSFVRPNPFGVGSRTPSVVAAAYNNSRPGATATVLFDFDEASDAFYRQQPPESGRLRALGNRIDTNVDQVGFDIGSTGAGQNTAWLVTRKRLFTVSLSTGLTTSERVVAGLNATVRDVAVLP